MSLFIDHILAPDIHANRPATTAVPVGTLFPCTTHGTIDRLDATPAWATWATVLTGALDDSSIAPVAPNDQTGTTYTFVLADAFKVVTASNASAQTYTVPLNSSVAYPLGAVLTLIAKGAGQITLVGAGGVTLNSGHGLKTSAQWATVSLTKILTDTWVVSGDTTT